VEMSGGERDTTNQRMEVTAACVALETIDNGHAVTVYSDSSYLVNCMRRGWYKKWRENGWLNHLQEPVANRDLWERLLEATERHQEVRWKKVKGHSKTAAHTRPETTGPTSSPSPQRGRLAVNEQR
jgi:ribonuclease HI